MGLVMSDIAILTAVIKAGLLEIAKQEIALGTGLQNAAPETGVPNRSVQYLLDAAEYLQEAVKQCDELLAASSSE